MTTQPIYDARHPELEQQIADNPYDHTAFATYADWLQQQGDPRGELVALHTRSELASGADADALLAAASAYLAAHASYLLGPLLDYVDNVVDLPVPFGWRHGFIQNVELDGMTDGAIAPILEQLFWHPSGRFVTDLELASITDVTRTVRVLATRAPPSVRGLDIASSTTLGDLSPVIQRTPRLQRLGVTAPGFELGALPVGEVTRARFRGAALSSTCVYAIGIAPWHALATLEIQLGREGPAPARASMQHLGALFVREDLPALTKLALRSCDFGDAIIAALVDAPIAAQLQLLDLAGTPVSDGAIRKLVRAHDRLPSLAKVVIGPLPAAFVEKSPMPGVIFVEG